MSVDLTPRAPEYTAELCEWTCHACKRYFASFQECVDHVPTCTGVTVRGGRRGIPIIDGPCLKEEPVR